jgi:hypothetical protein
MPWDQRSPRAILNALLAPFLAPRVLDKINRDMSLLTGGC